MIVLDTEYRPLPEHPEEVGAVPIRKRPWGFKSTYAYKGVIYAYKRQIRKPPVMTIMPYIPNKIPIVSTAPVSRPIRRRYAYKHRAFAFGYKPIIGYKPIMTRQGVA